MIFPLKYECLYALCLIRMQSHIGNMLGQAEIHLASFVLDIIQTYFANVILKFSDTSFNKAPYCVHPLWGSLWLFNLKLGIDLP